MKRIRITGTELIASRICLGTADYGGSLDKQESFRLLDIYRDRGGNFLDTAHVYSDWLPGPKGRSEKTLGEWLKLRNCQNSMILATKGGHPPLEDFSISRLSKNELRKDMEESLKNLSIDTIDIYYLHRDDPNVPAGEILGWLEEFRKAGMIRHSACSNWSVSRMKEAALEAERHGMSGFVASEVLWSLAEVNPGALSDPSIVAMDQEGRAYHKLTDIPVVPFTSQARGVISKWLAGQPVQEWVTKTYDNAENRARAARVLSMATATGNTPTAINLAWFWGQPFPVFPIVGCHTPEQLLESLSADDVQITETQARWLEGLDT